MNINPKGGNLPVATGSITAVTNAGFTQQAHIVVIDADSRRVAEGTFQGQGEGDVTAQLIGGGYTLSYSNAKLPLIIQVEFQYNPGSGFRPNDPDKVLMTCPYNDMGLQLLVFQGEDWIDGDFNDIVVRSITHDHN